MANDGGFKGSGSGSFHPDHVASGDPARDAWLTDFVSKRTCPRCGSDPLDSSKGEYRSRITTDRCIPICGSCGIEEDHQWAGGGSAGLLPTRGWPMHRDRIKERDVLIEGWAANVTVIENATVEDLEDLYDDDGWLAGPSATRASRGDHRVLFHHLDQIAMWEDGVLRGDEFIVNALWRVNESSEPVEVGAKGPWAVPDLSTHLGAFACGTAAGFQMTGDLPEGLES
jgi:hypothetical protein